jgi:DNA-binding LacI/PurR family transcriptional regulator
MEIMGTAAATIVLEAINANASGSESAGKKTVRTIHRRIVPELIVRESTCSVK